MMAVDMHETVFLFLNDPSDVCYIQINEYPPTFPSCLCFHYVQPLRHYPRMQQCLLYVTNSGASIVYGADIRSGYQENTDVVP